MSISIHAPRTGSDTKGTIQARLNTIISIHAPRTGSDKASINSRLSDLISIHAPRTGSDADIHVLHPFLIYFNPRSPHGERPFRLYFRGNRLGISIHAPRTGSDWRFAHVVNSDNISIHAPRTGSDSSPRFPAESTAYFNPRSPHGERPADAQQHDHKAWISIHAPRTGSDLNSIRWHGLLALFQSTLPARGATPTRYASPRGYRDFNPRSPHGERRTTIFFAIRLNLFQSTLPARGATTNRILIGLISQYFNPRSPHGERLRKVTILSIRIIGFAQKVYHKTVLLRISLAENAVILPEKPRNPVRTSLQKAGGLRFARAIRAARPYSISSPSGA